MGNTTSNVENTPIFENNKISSIIQPDILDIRDYNLSLPENQIIEYQNTYKIPLFSEFHNSSCNCLINNICYILYNQLYNINSTKNIDIFYPSTHYIEYIFKLNNETDNYISIRNILKLINKNGIYPESTELNVQNYTKFSKNFYLTYYKIPSKNLLFIKNLLLDNNLPIINISIYTSFDNKISRKNGVINLPDNRDSLIGLYSAIIIGYDDNINCFNILLPFNEQWENYIGKLSYDAFINTVNDIWVFNLNIKKNYNNELHNLKKNAMPSNINFIEDRVDYAQNNNYSKNEFQNKDISKNDCNRLFLS